MASLAVFVLLSVLSLPSLSECHGSDPNRDSNHEDHARRHLHHHRHQHHSHQQHPEETQPPPPPPAEKKSQPLPERSASKATDKHQNSAEKDDGSVEASDGVAKTVMPKYVDVDKQDKITMAVAPDGWSTPAAFPDMTTEIAEGVQDITDTQKQRQPSDDRTAETSSEAGHHSSKTASGQLSAGGTRADSNSEGSVSDQELDTSTLSPLFSDLQTDEGAADKPGRKPRKRSDRIRQVKLANRPRWQIRRSRVGDDEEDTESSTASGAGTRKKFPNRSPWFQEETDKEDVDGDATSHPERFKNRPQYQEWKRRQRKRDKLREGITMAKQLRQQVLKYQLVDKLRLMPVFKERPWPPKLPEQVFPHQYYQQDQPGKDEQYYAKPTELLIFGRELPRKHRLHRAATGSYQFGVTGKVRGSVTSAELWVYKMSDMNDVREQTLVVTELSFSKRKRLRNRSLVARMETRVQEGWLRFDVTQLVQRWVESGTPASLQMMAIRCKTCHQTSYRSIFGAKSNFRPVLVVHEQSSYGNVRERRSSQCDPESGCCKFELYLNFLDLGIHEIFYPRTIKADYCYGTCNRPDAAHYNHTVLLQRQRFGSFSTVNDTMWERLQPCCVPVVLREASIMYYLNDGFDTEVSTVPNLLVDKCGCA